MLNISLKSILGRISYWTQEFLVGVLIVALFVALPLLLLSAFLLIIAGIIFLVGFSLGLGLEIGQNLF